MEKEITESDLRSIPLNVYSRLNTQERDTLVWGLFDWLAHGDGNHRMWLFQAIYAYFNGLERPPTK
jgi:hypothetical protein